MDACLLGVSLHGHSSLCVLSVFYVLRSFSCKHTTHSRPGALTWPHFTLITPLQSCLQIWSHSEREGFSMWVWPSERHNSVPNRSTVENIPALKHLVNIQIKHPKGKVPGRCGNDRKKVGILEFHLALSIDFFLALLTWIREKTFNYVIQGSR